MVGVFIIFFARYNNFFISSSEYLHNQFLSFMVQYHILSVLKLLSTTSRETLTRILCPWYLFGVSVEFFCTYQRLLLLHHVLFPGCRIYQPLSEQGLRRFPLSFLGDPVHCTSLMQNFV